MGTLDTILSRLDDASHEVSGKAGNSKLVDDGYLRSSMTNHGYEVNSKTDPPAP